MWLSLSLGPPRAYGLALLLVREPGVVPEMMSPYLLRSSLFSMMTSSCLLTGIRTSPLSEACFDRLTGLVSIEFLRLML